MVEFQMISDRQLVGEIMDQNFDLPIEDDENKLDEGSTLEADLRLRKPLPVAEFRLSRARPSSNTRLACLIQAGARRGRGHILCSDVTPVNGDFKVGIIIMTFNGSYWCGSSRRRRCVCKREG